jgi:hypothetical protein
MKLRIKGNSLRVRVTPSEMMRLLETGRIEETIHFAPDKSARLTYALEHARDASSLGLRYSPQEIAVIISSQELRRWAHAEDVGLYAQVHTSHGPLQLAVEKDFACLDKNDAENADTFPNPQQGTVC